MPAVTPANYGCSSSQPTVLELERYLGALCLVKEMLAIDRGHCLTHSLRALLTGALAELGEVESFLLRLHLARIKELEE